MSKSIKKKRPSGGSKRIILLFEMAVSHLLPLRLDDDEFYSYSTISLHGSRFHYTKFQALALEHTRLRMEECKSTNQGLYLIS